MNKKWKIMAVLALIMISALTFNAAAQDYAIPAPVSNTNRATGANFATDVDNFLHFHNYGDVAFDKYFAYGGFRAYSGGSTGFNAYELNAGYARRFGGLYLGLFYAGQITEANPAAISTTTTEITDNTYTGGFFQKDNDRTVVTNTVTAPKFYNNLGALVGVAGMGIKVGFYETLWGTDKYPGTASNIANDVDGTKTVTTDITEYNRLYGWIVPYLGWGMKLSLGGLTIKPKASLDLAFFVDETKYSSATNNTTVNGSPVGTQTTGSSYTDNGYFSLGASIGADVDFAPVGSHSFGAGLSYAITPDIYSHKYDTASGEETVNGTVAVTNTNT
jgi:hypothetical protein